MTDLNLLSILIIALGLSADCFAVALSGSVAVKRIFPRQVLRISLSFGVFQALMLVLGWLAGSTIVELIADYDHYLAFLLLAFVGSRMIWESFHSEGGVRQNVDLTKGFLLLTLSIATSIDALAVGLTFAFLEVDIVLASATIGTVAFIVTAIGCLIGNKVGRIVGKRAEAIGGMVLISIGLRILLEHIL